jgi:hypothetical protein
LAWVALAERLATTTAKRVSYQALRKVARLYAARRAETTVARVLAPPLLELVVLDQ